MSFIFFVDKANHLEDEVYFGTASRLVNQKHFSVGTLQFKKLFFFSEISGVE